jgi:hypothetical protein
MDFIDQLKQYSSRVEKLKDQIKTEEATKTSLIMPFFQLLGYDVFNPQEFIPEFTADVGIKKGEKVDYAIVQDGKPVILIEAKWCGEALTNHDSQLFRYFGTTSAKFAILTNGIIYKFYTDLEQTNKMDERPFLEINILDIKDSYVNELKKFQKSSFDLETILNTASELKYTNLIKQFMSQQTANPSDQFVKFILGEIYTGVKTQNVIEKFREVVKKSLNQFINELMSERIKSALENKQADQQKEETEPEAKVENEKPETQILTTMAELEAFYLVKSILRGIVDTNKITYKDTKSYFGILYDNNSWKWICRLYLGEGQKWIILPDENKKDVRFNLKNVDDIYNQKDKLIEVVKRYIETK